MVRAVMLLVGLSVRTTIAAENELTFGLDYTAITVTTNESGEAVFGGVPLGGTSGQPGLPQVYFRILLPPDVDMASVTSTVQNTTIESVPGEWDVGPCGPVFALSPGDPIWPDGVTIVDGRDVDAYGTDALAPDSHIHATSGMQLRHWRMLAVTIAPYRYNPVSGALVWLKTGTLSVTFTRRSGVQVPASLSRTGQRVRERIRRQVVNFETMVAEYEN